jgi:hypothetical protein
MGRIFFISDLLCGYGGALRLLSPNGWRGVTGAVVRFYITFSGKINRNEREGGDGREIAARKIMLNMTESSCIAFLGTLPCRKAPPSGREASLPPA